MPGTPPVHTDETSQHRVLPIEAVRRLLRRDAYPNLARLLRKLHGSECAEILTHLSISEQNKLFERLLDIELTTSIFTYLDEDTRRELLPQLSTDRLVAIVRLLPPDDATDILGSMPPKRLTEMMDHLPEPLAAQITKLLSYDPQTAGGLMTTNFVALADTSTVAEALHMLRGAGRAETVFYLYVVDGEGHLVGVVSLRQLVMANPETTLRNLMETEVISVGAEEDQEHIARLITQYDFLALPVVDYSQCLVGIVTVDDIIDVITEEATEDMLRIAGVNPNEMLDTSSRRTIRNRLPWLSASWVGGLFASYVIDANQETLRHLVVLAAFFPVITGMGGNAATQSLAVAVRGLATGSIDVRHFGKALFKELWVGLSLGAIYGLLLGVVAFARQGTPVFGFVVGMAICISMTLAATLGGLLPIVFARLRVDPAVATGPFLTTTMDIIGLTIYLLTAKFIILS
jgi:magnesium transporter